MKTINITYNDFEELLFNKIKSLSKKELGSRSQNEVKLKMNEIPEIDQVNLLFISQILSVEMATDISFPHLRTNYGLPSGLMSCNNQLKTVQYVALMNPNDVSIPIYTSIRRALLHVSVWTIKNNGLDELGLFFKSVLPGLSEATAAMFFRIIDEITLDQGLPESKPSVESIDDTRFYYQQIWLGKHISQMLLKGSKMSDEQRNWFMNPFETRQVLNIEPFGDATDLILAYQAVAELSNHEKMNYDSLITILSKTVDHHIERTSNVRMFALFLMGLLQKSVDNYFPVAGAEDLFRDLELNAYTIAKSRTFSVISMDGFEKVRKSQNKPIENCVAYYRIKNPNIRNKKFALFGNPNPFEFPEMLPVVLPDQSKEFLLYINKLVILEELLEQMLFMTSNEETFDSLLSVAKNAILVKPSCMKAHVNEWNMCDLFLLNSISSFDSLSKFGGFDLNHIRSKKEIISQDSKDIVLITADFSISSIVIDLFFGSNYPLSLFVFNFESSNYHRSKSKDLKNRADFQAELEATFSGIPVRIVSKNPDDPNWEMVHMGINMLHKTSLDRCMIVDVRDKGRLESDYEIILRAFSDVIVYDENQRYLFMNL